MSLLENCATPDDAPSPNPGNACPAGGESVSVPPPQSADSEGVAAGPAPDDRSTQTDSSPDSPRSDDAATSAQSAAIETDVDHDLPPTSSRESIELAVIREVERSIADGTVDTYQSINGKVFLWADVAGLLRINHACTGPECRAWISALAHRRLGRHLPPSAAERVALTISGWEPTEQKPLSEDAGEYEAITKTPLVTLIEAFLEAQQGDKYEKRMSDFRDALKLFAEDQKSPGLVRAVPASASWLGRRLNRLHGLLLARGITLDRKVSNGKWVKLTKVPDGTPSEPSEMTSADSPDNSSAESAKDAIRERLAARLRAKRPPDSQGGGL
jgi:hypothetical protein